LSQLSDCSSGQAIDCICQVQGLCGNWSFLSALLGSTRPSEDNLWFCPVRKFPDPEKLLRAINAVRTFQKSSSDQFNPVTLLKFQHNDQAASPTQSGETAGDNKTQQHPLILCSSITLAAFSGHRNHADLLDFKRYDPAIFMVGTKRRWQKLKPYGNELAIIS
jgi:hypothetical protein